MIFFQESCSGEQNTIAWAASSTSVLQMLLRVREQFFFKNNYCIVKRISEHAHQAIIIILLGTCNLHKLFQNNLIFVEANDFPKWELFPQTPYDMHF